MAHRPEKRPYEVVDLTDTDPGDFQQLKRFRLDQALPSSSSQLNAHSQNERDLWSDVTAELPSTQGQENDDQQYSRLYGTIDHKIVGVRYYNGLATPGEFVVIRREPGNAYDRNAIRIDNVMRNQIGHIPKGIAAKLAPFLDNRSIAMEGELTGPKGYFDMPIRLRLYGTSDPMASSALKQELKEAKLPVSELIRAEREEQQRRKQEQKQREQERKQALKTAAQKAAGVRGSGREFEQNENAQFANITVPSGDPTNSTDPSMDSIMANTVSFNPRELGQVADKYGATEEVLAKLPFAQQPADLLTKLLPFQLQGLAWMLDRENPQLPNAGSQDTTQLWRANRDNSFTNIATQFTTRNPGLASGGILADDMGLGKTIQVLSLLVADPQRGTGPTLIVSPLSVMSNWSGQAQTHIRTENGLKVLIYHGTGRADQKPDDFRQYDIVVTTYQTVALDYMPGGAAVTKPKPVPRKTGLFSMDWRRVVLDEGHNIRSPKAKMTQAAYALLAQSRWILTGTPIVNNLRDLHSHIKFLRLTGGLEQNEVFTGTLMRPLNQQRPEAQILLQALMSTICLRRMKDMKFVDLRLPELSQQRYSIPMSQEERQTYDAFEKEAKGILIDFQTHRNSENRNVYASLLEVLLRMRQACNARSLCGEERISRIIGLAKQNQKIELSGENLKKLRDLLQLSVDSHEECAICMEPLHNPSITACAHVFGSECIDQVIETQGKCPMCRNQITKEDLVYPAVEESEPTLDLNTTSSKIEALLNILRATRKSKPDVKTIVFSQWSSFLDIVANQLKQNDFNFCRLDGRMNATARDDSMSRLDNDGKCTIMLASLGVCGVGLNLVSASQIIMSDSWWAPAIEDQAVDRVYRLGQTKPVTVFRLVIENSIEDRVLEIQQRKRELTMAAFGEKELKRKEKGAQMADIMKLLDTSSGASASASKSTAAANGQGSAALSNAGNSVPGTGETVENSEAPAAAGAAEDSAAVAARRVKGRQRASKGKGKAKAATDSDSMEEHDRDEMADYGPSGAGASVGAAGETVENGQSPIEAGAAEKDGGQPITGVSGARSKSRPKGRPRGPKGKGKAREDDAANDASDDADHATMDEAMIDGPSSSSRPKRAKKPTKKYEG